MQKKHTKNIVVGRHIYTQHCMGYCGSVRGGGQEPRRAEIPEVNVLKGIPSLLCRQYKYEASGYYVK